MKLFANAGISTANVRSKRTAGGGERRQRDAPPGRQRAHQHLPALAGLGDAADDIVHGDKNVMAPRGAVLKHVQRRQVAPTDFHARQVRRHKRNGNAEMLDVADETVGIIELECEPKHGRHRRKRDIALVPVEPDANHFAPLPHAAADHAGIGHRGGVGACFGTGESKAGNLPCVCEPRQPVVLLLLRAKAVQQLARSERVRHHRGDGAADRAGGNLADDFRMGVGGKAQSAIFLRKDHGKEFAPLEKIPDLRRQVAELPIDAPLVEHVAQFLDRAGQKCLLLGREACRGKFEQLAPIRVAAKQIGVPPHVAGFDGLAFGL